MRDVLTIIASAIALAATGSFIVGMGKKNVEDEKRLKKIYSSKVYGDLCSFEFHVAHCEITEANRHAIARRLQVERARNEMEDVVFNDKVNRIQNLFESRFLITTG